LYKIYSNVPGSRIRVNHKTFYGSALVSSKEKSLSFGWESPGFSKSYKIDVIKKLQKIGSKLSEKASNDFAREFAVKRLRINGMPDKAENAESLFTALDNTASSVNSVSHIKEISKGKKKGEDSIYFFTKNLVKGYSNVEGSIGMFIPDGTPLSAVFDGVSYGLIPLEEWYNTVDEMIDVANSKIIKKAYYLKVCAENSAGSDCKKIKINTEGFERVLK